MIEIESRYFLSKTASMKIGSAAMIIPNVLFAETGDRDSYPDSFEALLSGRRLETGKVQFVASRNEMIWGERQADVGDGTVTMPNFIPFSSLIEGIEQSYSRNGGAEVFIAVGRNERLGAELVRVSSRIVDLSNAPEAARDPFDMAMTLSSARSAVGFTRLIYAPGVATPQNLSLLIYAGVDIADSSAADLASVTGTAFVDGLLYAANALDEGICTCSACISEGADRALWHNRFQLLAELKRCRFAIRNGTLREYVESRASLSPWNAEFLKYLDTSHYGLFEQYAPNSHLSIKAVTEHSLTRPDILRYVGRVGERYRPPPLKIAVLVPCSNRKPYYLSKSHRLFSEAIARSENPGQVHTITVTSPLGIVPEELETVFPAADYDIPVTGRWSAAEKERSLEMLASILAGGGYSLIISHLSDEREFVNELLGEKGVDYVDTSLGNTRSEQSLRKLTDAINSAGTLKRNSWEERMRGLLSNLAAYQFGEGGRVLLSGAHLSGRFPNLRIIRERVQLGMLTQQRGVISLTLDGADAIQGSVEGYLVEMADFTLIGNLFAGGVEKAGESIRIGDEAIIRREGEVKGVGVASMSAREMNERKRGEAVHVRHVRKR